MNYTKNIMLFVALLATGLHAGQQLLQVEQAKIDALQDPIALNMIQAMQEAININQQAQLINKDFQAQQKGLRETAITSITALRAKNSSLARPDIAALQQLTIDENQSKFLFQRLLDEYLVHLGQVYEKKSGIFGLYRNVMYIASRNDQNLSITPNEYLALLQTLENAAQQKDWGTISLNLLVQQENGAAIEKSLTLHDIIGAIKQIPLPSNYYATATKVAAVVAAAAVIGVGAFFAYQAFGKDGQLVIPPTLEKQVTDIEKKLDVIPATENATTSTGNIDTPPAAFDATPTESAPNNPEDVSMNSDTTPADSDVSITLDQNIDAHALPELHADLPETSESAPEITPENVVENGGVNPQDALTENNIDAMATEPTNNNKVAISTGAAVGAGALFIASRGKAGRAQLAQAIKTGGQTIKQSEGVKVATEIADVLAKGINEKAKDISKGIGTRIQPIQEKATEKLANTATSVNKAINPTGHQAMNEAKEAKAAVSKIEKQILYLQEKAHEAKQIIYRDIEEIENLKNGPGSLKTLPDIIISKNNTEATLKQVDAAIKAKNSQLNKAQKTFEKTEAKALETGLNPLGKKSYETWAANNNVSQTQTKVSEFQEKLKNSQSNVNENKVLRDANIESYKNPGRNEPRDIADAKEVAQNNVNRFHRNMLKSQKDSRFFEHYLEKAKINADKAIEQAAQAGYNPAIQKAAEYGAAAVPTLAVAYGIS